MSVLELRARVIGVLFRNFPPVPMCFLSPQIPETLKLIKKKLGKTLEDMGTGGKFLNRTPIAYALRSRIDKWDLIKLQSFCKTKDTIKRTNRQPTNW